MNKKVAAYIRCSSDEYKKDGYSPKTQEEKIKEFINSNGYVLNNENIYIDLGRSGSTDKRPGFQRLLEDARNKNFDLIVVYRQDRFFRNLRLLLNIVAELRNLGIEFKSITEPFDTTTPTGRAMFANAGVFAEWQREIGLESRNEGMIKAMKEGKWLSGTAPYGYKRNPETSKLEIVPKEAKIVKMLYGWLVNEKLSLFKIQQRINVMKIPTKFDILKREKRTKSKCWWAKRTLGRLSSNELYTGNFYYRKYKNLGGVRKNGNIRPKNEWIEVKISPIISKKIFNLAQKQLEKKIEIILPGEPKGNTYYKKLITCGYDGRKYLTASRPPLKRWRRETKYYFCSATRKCITPNRCPSSSVSESRIATAIWNTLKTILLQPETAFKNLEQYRNHKNKEIDTEQEFKIVEKLIKAIEKKKERLVNAYVDGAIKESAYKDKLEKLRIEENDLLRKKEDLLQSLISEEEKQKRTESIKELYNRIRENLEKSNLRN